jgi:hypothetical protein
MSFQSVSRRRFLVGAAVAAGAAPFAACLLSRPAMAQDLAPLPADNATAVALAYAEDAATVKHASFKAGSDCANCQFFTGKAGEARGGCSLFPTFSVASKGWCSAWAAKPA